MLSYLFQCVYIEHYCLFKSVAISCFSYERTNMELASCTERFKRN